MTIDAARPKMPTESPARGIDRRQLMRAGAWAAPVLLVAVASPAATASVDPPPPPGEANWQRNPVVVSANISANWNGQFTAFQGIYGNGYPEIAETPWGASVLVVSQVNLTITVPKAGMAAAAGTITGSGWTPNGWTESATTIAYAFVWKGTILTRGGSRQFAFSDFRLPATPNVNLATISQPIPVNFLFTSAQLSVAATGYDPATY